MGFARGFKAFLNFLVPGLGWYAFWEDNWQQLFDTRDLPAIFFWSFVWLILHPDIEQPIVKALCDKIAVLVDLVPVDIRLPANGDGRRTEIADE